MHAEARIWDKAAVLELVQRNNEALSKALWNLYQRQTATEQSNKTTIIRNGVGFNSRDAEFLSDVARKLPKYDFNMTRAQRTAVRRRITKYWRQILEEIEEKGGKVSYAVAKSPKSETAPAAQAQAPMTLYPPKPPEQPMQWGSW